jgi:hypothetical protein
MGRTAALILAAMVVSGVCAQDGAIEATTASGEKVRLLPNGRWEYSDPKKAEPQRKAQAEERERERNSQGGWLGIGRRIQPGDKEYNRGSLSPNRR